MKRIILFSVFLALCSFHMYAQSSMTDEQVLRYVMKEHEAGTSQSQIITKLMQRGVDIQQIRRVKKTYERVAKDKGLGQVSAGTTKEKTNDRMRKNNGAEKEDHNSDFKIKLILILDRCKVS